MSPPARRRAGRIAEVEGVGVRSALAAAGDLVLPRTCAGCDRPGAALCPRCRAAVAALALTHLGPVSPRPVPPGWPGCTGTVRYEGVAARLVRTFKDGARRDLADVLGRMLADSVRRTLPDPLTGRRVLLVPVPSSPEAIRRRGDQPTLLLARRAASTLGPWAVVEPGLRATRGTADQAGLARAERLANLAGAMSARRHHRLRGRHCVLVDDVLTSGATLMEGRRALVEAGASRVDLAVVMVTPRRSPGPGLPFRSGPD